jgi:hypothetical protein
MATWGSSSELMPSNSRSQCASTSGRANRIWLTARRRVSTLKEKPQRTPRPIPPDQDQRDRQEVRAHDLHPGLVRVGKREVPPAPCVAAPD